MVLIYKWFRRHPEVVMLILGLWILGIPSAVQELLWATFWWPKFRLIRDAYHSPDAQAPISFLVTLGVAMALAGLLMTVYRGLLYVAFRR